MDEQTGIPVAQTCYRHQQTPATILCQRCGQPICPDCMRDAAVGFQCPSCAGAGPKISAPFGGTPSRDPRITSMVLIGINVAVWLGIMATGQSLSGLVDLLALTPRGRCLAAEPGAFYPGLTTPASCAGTGVWQAGQATGAPWQVLTSAFTHVAAMHIAFNMVALWSLGPAMEQVLGRARFLAIYLGSALTASALVMWASSPVAATLGASGAIFGLMGVYLLLAQRAGTDLRSPLMWLGMNLLITFLPGTGISWQGHLGGLLGGLALGAIILYCPREKRPTWQWAGVAVVVVLAIVAIALRMPGLAA